MFDISAIDVIKYMALRFGIAIAIVLLALALTTIPVL